MLELPLGFRFAGLHAGIKKNPQLRKSSIRLGDKAE